MGRIGEEVDEFRPGGPLLRSAAEVSRRLSRLAVTRRTPAPPTTHPPTHPPSPPPCCARSCDALAALCVNSDRLAPSFVLGGVGALPGTRRLCGGLPLSVASRQRVGNILPWSREGHLAAPGCDRSALPLAALLRVRGPCQCRPTLAFSSPLLLPPLSTRPRLAFFSLLRFLLSRPTLFARPTLSSRLGFRV